MRKRHVVLHWKRVTQLICIVNLHRSLNDSKMVEVKNAGMPAFFYGDLS
jgi:hypothetical protein